jgi:hypothetical protein
MLASPRPGSGRRAVVSPESARSRDVWRELGPRPPKGQLPDRKLLKGLEPPGDDRLRGHEQEGSSVSHQSERWDHRHLEAVVNCPAEASNEGGNVPARFTARCGARPAGLDEHRHDGTVKQRRAGDCRRAVFPLGRTEVTSALLRTARFCTAELTRRVDSFATPPLCCHVVCAGLVPRVGSLLTYAEMAPTVTSSAATPRA